MFFEALPPHLLALLKRLPSLSLPGDVYLAGGTAAALHLGHRRSIDIDLFAPSGFNLHEIILAARSHFAYEPILERTSTLQASMDGVKFSLFHHPYVLIDAPLERPDIGVRIASPRDIALMKIVAIYQRGSAKDFVDLKYLIDRQAFVLSDLLSHTLRKYSLQPDTIYPIRKALVYFDDAERDRPGVTMIHDGRVRPLSDEEWAGIKDFFVRAVALDMGK